MNRILIIIGRAARVSVPRQQQLAADVYYFIFSHAEEVLVIDVWPVWLPPSLLDGDISACSLLAYLSTSY
eukprot:scaffold74226_cov51-Attheya_sp.AAC.6